MTTPSHGFLIDRSASEAFARLSGDYNPLHLDPIVARRTAYGRCVLHGAHVFLRALATRGAGFASLQLRFLRPAFADMPLTAEHTSSEMKVVDASGSVLMTASIAPGPAVRALAVAPVNPPAESPARLAVSDANGFHYEASLGFDPALADHLFPSLRAHLSDMQLAEILAVTRAVGMKCPGLYSTLTGLHLRPASGPARTSASFRIASLHTASGRVRIGIEGSTMAGEVEAFFRPHEVDQPRLAEVAQAVAPGTFAGRAALIIGGSRGLGELAAKIFAAGGARVAISYRVGANDARRVAAEITAAGGSCQTVALDVAAPRATWPTLPGFVPTDLLYFATSHIGGPGPRFEFSRFAELAAVYVDGFVAAVDHAMSLGASALTVFHPSTAFLDSTEGAPEYVAAKAASEAVAAWLGRRPGIRMRSVRLPPLATDETISLLKAHRTSALPILLAALRGEGES